MVCFLTGEIAKFDEDNPNEGMRLSRYVFFHLEVSRLQKAVPW